MSDDAHYSALTAHKAHSHLQVAVALPLRNTLTYLPPADCDIAQCPPGTRLWVPVGRLKCLGVVTAHCDPGDFPSDRIRHALEVLDDAPLLGEEDLKLAEFTWQYYHLPPGHAVAALLPPQLRKNKHSGELDFLRPKAPSPEADRQVIAPAVGLPGLTEEQAQTMRAVRKRDAGFAPILIEGVTGSGKTEIYLRLMEDILHQGGQVLYLVPEIGLTPQAEYRVKERFAVSSASLHSSLSSKKRLQIWERARTGELEILVGTRLAAFTPLPRLALIVVDEEHDNSFRQGSGAFWSARDVAIWRASQRKIPILLGSATPALETLHNAGKGRYRHLRMSRRFDGMPPPAIQIVDRRRTEPDQIFTPGTVTQIQRQLDAGKQALLFLNRRGWAQLLLCADCGWRHYCDRCDATTVLHLRRRAMLCHHCGKRSPIPESCEQCGSVLSPTGAGTERLEQWCKSRFPDIDVCRIDSDSTQSAARLKKMLARAETETPGLLVGTSMLTKGHHLPHLGLVAIADASLSLLHPDFRTAEMSAQMLIQVAGRAGREMQGGQVLLETSLPNHPLIRQLSRGDYPAIAASLLEQRRRANLPPFVHMAALLAESSRQGEALDVLEQLKRSLPPMPKLSITGPMPRAMERVNNRWRALMQVYSASRPLLHRAIRTLALEADQAHRPGLAIDIRIDSLETL